MAHAPAYRWPDQDIPTGQPDAARIGAWTATLALNLGLLLVLAMPMDTQRLAVPDPIKPQSRLDVVPTRPEPPPLPPPQVPVPQRTAQAPSAPVRQPVTHTPAPAADVARPIDIPVPAHAVPSPPDLAPGPGPAASPGQAPSQLRYIRAPAPRYPVPAVRAGQEGTVWLRVQVDAGGRPVSVEVERSSGHRVLDEAARRQVLSHWTFEPARRDGTAVPAWGRIPIEFSMDR